MTAPTLETIGANVKISFTAPSTNGAAITSYKLSGLKGSVYEDITAQCSGGNSSVLSNQFCIVPMSYFVNSLNNAAGSYLKVKVQAQNSLGLSDLSPENADSVKAQVKPPTKITAITFTANTTAVVLSWTPITSDSDIGYSPILSYSIYIAESTGAFQLVQTTTSVTGNIISPLVKGKTYRFRITS